MQKSDVTEPYSSTKKKIPTLQLPDKEGRFLKVDGNTLMYQDGFKGATAIRNTPIGNDTAVTLEGKKASLSDLPAGAI